MKQMLAVLAATTALTLAAPTFAASESTDGSSKVSYKSNGGYDASRSSEQTSTDGTTTKSKGDVDVDVDSNGKTTKTVKAMSSTDPKGLGNKKADIAKTTYEDKDRGGYKETTVRKHKDANGTNTTYTTTTDVDVDTDGNVTTTAKTEKTVDPKGLMNSKTTTTKTKSVNGKVVSNTTSN